MCKAQIEERREEEAVLWRGEEEEEEKKKSALVVVWSLCLSGPTWRETAATLNIS